ncbi:hypothetical protein, partial [Escherichia coli]|uniref:hypothetical protein n=1 Tax=Escherichia coli TaxID=562 RepID=UPI0013B41133
YLIQKQLDEQKASDDENKIVTYLKKQLQIIETDINNLHYTIKSKTTADGIHPEKIHTGSDAIRKYLLVLKNNNRDCDDMSLFTE